VFCLLHYFSVVGYSDGVLSSGVLLFALSVFYEQDHWSSADMSECFRRSVLLKNSCNHYL